MYIFIGIWLIAIALPIVGSFTFWKVTQPLDFYKPLILFVSGLVGSTLLLFLFLFLAGLFFSKKRDYVARPSRFATKVLAEVIVFIHIVCNVKVKVLGKKKLPTRQKFLLVCNHRSNFDPMILVHKIVPYGTQFISKPSNFKIPFAGPFMRASGYLAINREDKEQSFEVLKKCVTLLKNKKSSIGVFPEGTRQQKEIIAPFHEGVFNIAIHAQVPLVICAMSGQEEIRHRAPFRRTHVLLNVIGVIPADEVAGYTAKALSDLTWSLMKDYLEQ